MTEEQRNAHIHNILYSTDSREELAQRIVALEELVARIWPFARAYLGMLPSLGINDTESYDIEADIRELGIEVNDE